MPDRGIFSDLDPQVQLPLPTRLADPWLLVDPKHSLLLLYSASTPIKVYPLLGPATATLDNLPLRPGDHHELTTTLPADTRIATLAPHTTAPPGDADDDGIPNPLDISLGALKTTLNAARYDQRYFTLAYPGGDVPRELGACTDVIVRSLRNAGIDLQVELAEDIARHGGRYPMVTAANHDIDHRRVRTLLPYFRAHWLALDDDAELQPGDVVFMDTIADRKGPDHIGVIGHLRGERGSLLVANNWTDGSTTAYMDLLEVVPVTDRFRMPPAPEHGGPIAATVRQLIAVEAATWDSFRARAQAFAREQIGGAWQPVGPAFDVVLGRSGLAWGRGLHGQGPPADERGPIKHEGDGRSPAGVFALGLAYGRAASAPELALDYVSESASLRCVDDPNSAHYNRIVDAATLAADWTSAEPMRSYYELAIVVAHNRERDPAAGSCIFLHAWRDADTPVSGCTAMAAEQLDALAHWLEPGAMVVALPQSPFAKLGRRWGVPRPNAR